MLPVRVIPVLLLRNGGLVKGTQFKDHKYVGDPVNSVKLFNDKSVDELVFLDIGATENGSGPNFELLADIASQAFMPLGYGGGISQMQQVERLIQLGVEKVVINTEAHNSHSLIKDASRLLGAQSVVVSMDVKKTLLGSYSVFKNSGKVKTSMKPVEYAKQAEALGAGELIITSIDREGTGKGYDLELIRMVSSAVSIPVVCNGGASGIMDFKPAITSGASAIAAGNMFVYHGRHKAVLITYPDYSELQGLFEGIKSV